MDERWLRRIDAHLEHATEHMARGNELFERGNELFERNERAFERFIAADDRNTEAFERNTEAFERNTRAFESWQSRQDRQDEFMREITLRVELAGRAQIVEMRQLGSEIVSELRAQRGALLAVLDRLSPPPPEPRAS